jgi:hypothetical protein
MRQLTVLTAALAILLSSQSAFAMRDPYGMMPGLTPTAGSAAMRFGAGEFQPHQQYADGMNLYQYLRSRPLSYTDPSGLVSKPSKQCTLDKAPFTLLFDGAWLSGGGASWDAVSGRPVKKTVIEAAHDNSWNVLDVVFDNSVERQKIRGVGPIPAGNYWMNICEESSPGGSGYRRQSFRHWVATRAWGVYSVSLHPEPETDTYGRGGFFIHGGKYWGSAGCIDIKEKDAELDKLFEKAYKENGCKCCYVPLAVEYQHAYVTKRETNVYFTPNAPGGP